MNYDRKEKGVQRSAAPVNQAEGKEGWSDLLDSIPKQKPQFQAKDPLIMVNVGTETETREVPLSAHLDEPT